MSIHADDIMEFESSVRRIACEEIQAALASAGLLPSPYKSVQYDALTKKVQIWLDVRDPEAIDIKVYPSNQIIEWSGLIRSFQSFAMHAGFIYDHLRKENVAPPDDVANQKALVNTRHSAMRKAITMRDSADQIARLLKGEDLDPEEEITGASRGR